MRAEPVVGDAVMGDAVGDAVLRDHVVIDLFRLNASDRIPCTFSNYEL